MKEEILEYFKDINYVYNDCTRYDTLKRMIDELQEPKAESNELIDMLTMIKGQAVKNNNDTIIKNIKIDSLNFVIDKAIKALEPKQGGD